MIVDAHSHPLDEAVGNLSAMQRFVDVMNACNVRQSVCLGPVGLFGANPSEQNIRKSNDVSMAIVARWPDRFIGFCYLNPLHKKEFVSDEIDRCIKSGPFRGIKLWVAANAQDDRLDPIMQAAAELEVPVLIHAWHKTVGRVFNESSPYDIHILANRHTETTIIMAHLTGSGYRGILDVRYDRNVFVDTSGSQPYRGVLEFAVRTLGAERILFGSDSPIRDLNVQLSRITDSGIAASDKEMILGRNLRSILRME